MALLKDLFYARETLRNIAANRRGASSVECTHCKLRTRLADCLRCNSAYCFAKLYKPTFTQILTVTAGAHPMAEPATQWRTDGNLFHLCCIQCLCVHFGKKMSFRE